MLMKGPGRRRRLMQEQVSKEPFVFLMPCHATLCEDERREKKGPPFTSIFPSFSTT